MQEFDVIVLGGGIFGVYAALYLAGRNQSVCLIEKEPSLFSKASVVNQARLHGGYHYPRSMATAQMAHEYQARFMTDHKPFINNQYESYYGIDRSASLTSSSQFEQFCEFIPLPFRKVTNHSLFNMTQLEALYLTEEYSFDTQQMAAFYIEKLKANKHISLQVGTQVMHAEKNQENWLLEGIIGGSTDKIKLKAPTVINATYSGINSINRLFGMQELDLLYVISEIAFVHSSALANTGLTIIDGPFASYLPFGHSGTLSLSSVRYTHHKISYSSLPTFDCQEVNPSCKPDFISNCNICTARPASDCIKMIEQLKKYLRQDISLDYLHSSFAIKTNLKSSVPDASRPTEIIKLHTSPDFFYLFSGKINSIYEIEKVVDR